MRMGETFGQGGGKRIGGGAKLPPLALMLLQVRLYCRLVGEIKSDGAINVFKRAERWIILQNRLRRSSLAELQHDGGERYPGARDVVAFCMRPAPSKTRAAIILL